jgi:hypothetical protein
MKRHACRVSRLDRGDRVSLDARDLNKASDRIASQSEVMLHTNLGGVLDLL